MYWNQTLVWWTVISFDLARDNCCDKFFLASILAERSIREESPAHIRTKFNPRILNKTNFKKQSLYFEIQSWYHKPSLVFLNSTLILRNHPCILKFNPCILNNSYFRNWSILALPACKRSAPTCRAASGSAPRPTAPGQVWNGSRRLLGISNGTCAGVKRPRASPSIWLTDYF